MKLAINILLTAVLNVFSMFKIYNLDFKMYAHKLINENNTHDSSQTSENEIFLSK